MSAGGISFGGLALGFIAQGGLAIGKFARGHAAIGVRFPRRLAQLHWLFGRYPPKFFDSLIPILFTLGPMVIVGGLIALVALWRIESAKATSESSPS